MLKHSAKVKLIVAKRQPFVEGANVLCLKGGGGGRERDYLPSSARQ